MKKYFCMLLGITISIAAALPALAIVLAPGTAQNVPFTYATVKGDKILYDRQITAYCSNTFNKILEAYGLELSAAAVKDVPLSYAKTSGGNVIFNNDSTAYAPVQYHSIFTSYGLELSPEEVQAKLGAINYVKVVNGKFVFADGSYAYSGDELALILSAYNLSMMTPETTVMKAAEPAKSADSDKDGVPDTLDKCPDTPRGAVIDERGCWVLNAAYLFDFDKSNIKTMYYQYLDDVVIILNDNPTLKIEIQGHADSTGSDLYNQGLSERRAKSIRTYLIDKNIDSSRLTFVGFGEEQPAFSNDNEESRAKNRRVELKPIW